MGRLHALPGVAFALLLILLVPSVSAAGPSVAVTSGDGFSRPLAGSEVTYKFSFEVTPAAGESRVILELALRDRSDRAVDWESGLVLHRVGASRGTQLPTLSGFDDPITQSDVYEGKHELTVKVQTPETVGEFTAYIELAVYRPDGSERSVGGTYRYDFLLQPPPDDDNDGLSNAREAELGTDPNKYDTDGDGLTDCQEVRHTVDSECREYHFGALDGGYGTDPTKADTDGDGLRDDVEARFGTDPTTADTDGDGLNDCQETRHTKASECGKVASTLEDGGYKSSPWVADEDQDGLLEGKEVELGSDIFNEDTDQDGLLDGEEAHGTLNGAFANAATDPTKEDSDGDGLSDYDEIMEYGTNPNAKDTDGDGLLDTDEVKGPNSPLKADTDDDGLNDSDERIIHKTHPADPDTDGDGLSDGDEVLKWNTRPLDPDTDGDGLEDGDEVEHGSDPHNHDSDGDGLNDGPEVHTHGTDPAHFDSDLDGVADGEEVQKWKTDPADPDSDADGLEDGRETVLGTDPLHTDTDRDGWLDGTEAHYGGDPLDADTTPPDFDNDLVTDLEDPDADGDGIDDVKEALEASQNMTRAMRLHAPLHMRDEPGLKVVFEVEPREGMDGAYLWRQDGQEWVRVAGGTARLEDPDGRDGAQYRFTAYRTIGAKTIGNATDLAGFDELDPWELFVTSARFDGDHVVLRAGEDHRFVLEVRHDGGTETQAFDVDARSQQTVAMGDLLEGVTGHYKISWSDGGDAFAVSEGQLGSSGTSWILWAGVAAALLVGAAVVGFLVVRKRR